MGLGVAPWQVSHCQGADRTASQKEEAEIGGRDSVLTTRKTIPSLGTQVLHLWGSQDHLRAQ